MRGFTSELISLFATILSTAFGIFLYKPNSKSFIFSTTVFGIMHVLGNYIAITNKRFGVFQFIGGIVLGIFKFFLLLIFVVSISLVTNIYSKELLETDIVKLVIPYAQEMKILLSKFA